MSVPRRPFGLKPAAYQWDVGDFDACVAGVKAVETALGPIDILVNNAGIVRDSPLHKMSKEQWDTVIRTDLNALFNMIDLRDPPAVSYCPNCVALSCSSWSEMYER